MTILKEDWDIHTNHHPKESRYNRYRDCFPKFWKKVGRGRSSARHMAHRLVPSCICLKSDQSMMEPPYFSSETRRAMVHRTLSPVPICRSVKSDRPMMEPACLSSELLKPIVHRPLSPVPICRSVKSDWPMMEPACSSSEPLNHRSQESGEFTDEPLNIKNYECDNEKSRVTKEYFVGTSAEKEIESIGDRSVVPEVFTPESNPYNDRKSYRFPCSSEGLFQCRYTGLVFKMDTEGEVEYRTEPWNYTQLANCKYVPAGPLFNIKCPQGTLSQIRFPHCEVFSGKGRKHLSVIHISDSDEYEMLDPHETTDSYVILNISGCSGYGLAKEEDVSPINGLVLLFLQESTLNVLLLPKNVDIYEVSEKRKKLKEPTEEIYIETTANCELVPKNKYCLSFDPEEHEVNPSSAKFLDYENYSNYIPTFQVLLTKFERVKLNLKGEGSDECVWYSNLKFPASLIGGRPSVSSPSSPYTPLGQDFFHKHKAALEARLGSKITILSELERLGVLNTEEREEVKSNESRINQNRTLLLMLENKGGTAQEKFYRVLKKCDGCLVEDLEGPYDYGT